MSQPQVIDLDLPHLRMTALAWGPQDGRIALCLHGFPDSAWTWRRIAPLLADRGYRVVAPFTRGYAPTAVPCDGDYTIGALMYDALAVHDYLGGDDAVLIGHDWGAFTAAGIAAYPGSPFAAHITMSMPPVAAMLATSLSLGRRIRLGLAQLPMSWYVTFFQVPVIPQRVTDRVIPRLWRGWSSPGLDVGEEVANALAALPARAHRNAAVSYYRALVRFSRPAPRYAQMHAYRFAMLRRPHLHLQGTSDGAMQVGWTETMVDHLPAGSVVKVQDTGHFNHVEEPAQVADAIVDFVSAQDLSRRM
jgi:pimeloyl-ACP methyl ester carboxylesterase